MESNLLFLDDEIDRIIENKNQSTQRIEQILDMLLDYGQMGVGEVQFKKLNSYYNSFNKENSDSYTGFYLELIEED